MTYWHLNDALIEEENVGKIINTLPVDSYIIELEIIAEGFTYQKEKSLNILEDFSDLQITEIFPNPKGKDIAGENEWVEIYNPSSRSIKLNGLTLQCGSSEYIFEEQRTLSPNGYFVLYPRFSLPNTGGTIEILNTVESLTYEQPVGDNESVINISNEAKITTTPTPGTTNKYTPKLEDVDTDFSDIIIDEVLANPEGSDEKGKNEWVKVHNTSDSKVNLRGLVLTQKTSSKSKHVIEEDTLLKPNSYFTIFPSFAVNNSSAILEISNGVGDTFDFVFYDTQIGENELLVRKVGSNTIEVLPKSFIETSDDNKDPPDIKGATTIVNSIQNTRDLPEGTVVEITGTVNVDTGVLGEDEFYIQDETAGIKVQLPEDKNGQYKVNETVTITGEIDTYHKEPRIRPLSEQVVKHGNAEIIDPLVLKISQFNSNHIGMLIKISGTVTKTSGNTFYVTDGTGEIKVLIRDSTGIERPECRKGYYAEITGILSVWDTDPEGNLNYRLLPRYQEDVYISKTLANTGSNIIFEIILGAVLLSSSAIANDRKE